MYDIKTILKDKSFVREIQSLNEERRKSLYRKYCKIILTDFSILHITEIWKDEELDKYSYYWLSANNEVIIGWDNAPHHEEISTFPHHKHTANDGIVPSTERNLLCVIEYISKKF